MQSIATLYNDVANRLGLKWHAGLDGAFRILPESQEGGPVDLVGHLNLIHARRIQIIGRAETEFFDRLSDNRRVEYLNDFLNYGEPAAFIMADGMAPQPFLIHWCDEHIIPLFGSSEHSSKIIEYLHLYFNRLFAQRCYMHGVLMDVLGVGVLISGDSGLGKSELALELISRGHGLVADDQVEFSRIAPDFIEGRCPPLLQNLLEVRGIGLLDIKTIFGETSVRRKIKLRLLTHLVRLNEMEGKYDRLPMQRLTENILGVEIQKVVLPVSAGRNLAVLVEAAVRDTVLKLRGINTLQEFIQRQRQAMDESQTDASGHNSQGNI